MKKLLFFFAFLFPFLLPTSVLASEGITEIRSTNRESYRCVATGQQMGLNSYRTLVTCRDLIYPQNSDPIRYIMWANPTFVNKGQSELIKFGKLDFGKKLFAHGRPYTSIFVTVEKTAVEKPTGPIVMQGTTRPFDVLDFPTSPTPTPEGQFVEEIVEEVQDANATEAPSTKKKTTSTLKVVGVILAVTLFIGAVVALILIQRSKKR